MKELDFVDARRKAVLRLVDGLEGWHGLVDGIEDHDDVVVAVAAADGDSDNDGLDVDDWLHHFLATTFPSAPHSMFADAQYGGTAISFNTVYAHKFYHVRRYSSLPESFKQRRIVHCLPPCPVIHGARDMGSAPKHRRHLCLSPILCRQPTRTHLGIRRMALFQLCFLRFQPHSLLVRLCICKQGRVLRVQLGIWLKARGVDTG